MKREEESSNKRKVGVNFKKDQTVGKNKKPYKPLTGPNKIVRVCWKCNRNHQAWECPELKGKCYRCGEIGHMAKQCQNPRDLKCYYCGQPGHIATNCPAKAQRNQTLAPALRSEARVDNANSRRGRPRPQAQARVYAMQQAENTNEDDMVAGE